MNTDYLNLSSRNRSYLRRVMPHSISQSPIAEDGGFGPMDYESSKGTDEDTIDEAELDDVGNSTDRDDFGDFDDFEEGFQELEDVETSQTPAFSLSSNIEPVPFVRSHISFSLLEAHVSSLFLISLHLIPWNH